MHSFHDSRQTRLHCSYHICPAEGRTVPHSSPRLSEASGEHASLANRREHKCFKLKHKGLKLQRTQALRMRKNTNVSNKKEHNTSVTKCKEHKPFKLKGHKRPKLKEHNLFKLQRTQALQMRKNTSVSNAKEHKRHKA